jgi:hypothetical protein
MTFCLQKILLKSFWKCRSFLQAELRTILDPADLLGPDYPSETFRVLKNKEIRQFGEYRTQRLVLEAWDRLCGRQAPGQLGSYGEKVR